jgi:mannose-6-phosphate isomerase-like protein (cupin superfamily)
MDARPIVVSPGEGHRLGNVEFLARTADTPRFTFAIIEIVPGRVLEEHVHADEDDAFYILEGELTFAFGDEEAAAGPDRRIGLSD